ncbi:MAG: YncE family protein [Acetobacteraceae bacterium]
MPPIGRRALLAGGVAVAGSFASTAHAAPAGGPVGPEAGIAIVMNSAGASISIVDMASEKLIRDVPVLREPHHWTLSPGGRELWVGDASGNTLFALSPTTGEPISHRVLSDPYQFWISPNGKLLVVNALRLNHVDVYDADSLSLIHRFHAFSMPSHLAYAPDSSMVYATLQGSESVVAIDLLAAKVAWKAKIGPAPAGIVWHQDHLLAALMNANDIVMVDPTDGSVMRRIPTGRGAHMIVVSPDRRLLYVANRVAGTIEALDWESLRPLRRYSLTGGPDCIAFAPDGRLWISRRWADSIAVMDPSTGAFTLVGVGRSPHGVFLSPMLNLYAEGGRAALGTSSV